MQESGPANWQEEVRQKIERAKATALPSAIFEPLRQKENELIASLMRGDITKQEFGEQNILSSNEEGLAVFGNLAEFIEALKVLNLPKDVAGEILAHENDHRLIMDKNGIKAQYALRLVAREKKGTFSATPSVRANFDEVQDSWDKDRSIMKEAIEAPEQLSDSDKKALGL